MNVAMKGLAAFGLLLSLVCGGQQAWAGSSSDGEPIREPWRRPPQAPYAAQQDPADTFNFGLGFIFADLWPENSTAGWDVQVGIEKPASDGWNFGAQAHMLSANYGDTDLQSMALYATARPENKWLQWLQFKAGVVSADYHDRSQTYNPSSFALEWKTTAWSGTGGAVGAGVVIGGERFKLHLLDIHRYFVAGHRFDVYSINLLVVLGALGHR